MRGLLVFSLITLLVAAHLQHDAFWWAEVQDTIRAEANADAISLQVDGSAIRLRLFVAPAWMRSQWEETKSDIETLHADIDGDAQQCRENLKRAAQVVRDQFANLN